MTVLGQATEARTLEETPKGKERRKLLFQEHGRHRSRVETDEFAAQCAIDEDILRLLMHIVEIATERCGGSCCSLRRSDVASLILRHLFT